jgi:tripartite-type tricarboxylate transporter receptor subunit TctC
MRASPALVFSGRARPVVRARKEWVPGRAAHGKQKRETAMQGARAGLRGLYVAALAVAGALGALGASNPAAAQDYPNKPVELVVGIGAGSTTDVTARVAAKFLSQQLKRPVIVVNKPGAGGTIGADYVAHAPADGYTLLWASGSLPAFHYLYKLRFDPLRDLAPVGEVAQGGLVMITRPDAPWKNLAELVAYAKSKPPGTVTYASAGIGSNAQIFSEIFAQTTGLKFLHIPYKGSSAALTDVLDGTIDFVFDGLATSKPLIEAGRVHALAYSAATRSTFLPQVPTMAQAGVPQFSQRIWLGIFAPGGTPQPIIDKLSEATNAFVATPEFKHDMSSNFYEPFPLKSAAFAELMRKETAEWDVQLARMNVPRAQ